MTKALINFPFPEKDLDRLRKRFQEVVFILSTDREKTVEHLGESEIIIPFFELTREMLDAAPHVKWIQAVSAGVDYMPLDLIQRRGILLTNGRGIHRVHMAEYALASLLGLARNFHLLSRNQRQHRWDRSVPQGEIYGATLGIVGLGSIGRAVAEKAHAFGMKVIGVKRRPEPVAHVDEVYGPEEMAEVFKRADYVINLLPYTPETERLIDGRYFGLMQNTACFVNIGRGKTVNETDLAEALQKRKIRALVSDVFYDEPLPEGSPLWDMDNVMITPHICGASPRYMERAAEIIAHNLAAYLGEGGEMINRVDLERGY